MFKNAAECDYGLIDYDDVVQNPEQQLRKKYSNEKSLFPDGSNILANASEVLR